MALLSHTFNDLGELLVQQLEDLYDAEKRLVEALPKMANAATSADLKNAFEMHLEQTEEHVTRLEEVFRRLGQEPDRETCPAMKGLIEESQEIISAKGDPAVRDAGLIGAAQKVEHYEIAGYGTVRTYARQLGYQDVERTLQQTLDEEAQADKVLTRIAEGHINRQASA